MKIFTTFQNKSKYNKIILIIFLLVGVQYSLNAQSSLLLDGSDDYIRTSSYVSQDNTWTYETWVKANDPSPDWSGIITSASGEGTGMWFQFSLDGGGKLRWESSDPGFSISGIGPVINDNTWHHVAVTCDGTNLRIYTDGVLQNTSAFTGGTMDRTVHIMAERVPNQFIPGEVDKTMIWDYARSLSEIQNDMSNCLTGDETGLLIYYQYEDGAGSSTVTDYAPFGGNNTGNLMNMNTTTAWVSNSSDLCRFSLSKYGGMSPNQSNNVNKNGGLGGDGLSRYGKIIK